MDIEMTNMLAAFATLGVALAALGVSAYAVKLARQTGAILEETKKVLTSTKEVLEYQQCALIASGEILGGSDFSNKLMLKTWNLNKLKEAEKMGSLKNLRFSRTGELYFEADGDPSDRKAKEPDKAEEQTTKEAPSPREPLSQGPTLAIERRPQSQLGSALDLKEGEAEVSASGQKTSPTPNSKEPPD